MKLIYGIILGFILSACVAFADKISAPPPLKDANVFHYFRQIYENLHRLEVVTSNPDGSRSGLRGDMLLLQTGGTSYIQVNTNSVQEWRGIALSNTP